jgi:hypothetical protein
MADLTVSEFDTPAEDMPKPVKEKKKVKQPEKLEVRLALAGHLSPSISAERLQVTARRGWTLATGTLTSCCSRKRGPFSRDQPRKPLQARKHLHPSAWP